MSNPHYNLHPPGFFITPSPRKADILLVVGPVNDQMRGPVREVYEAIPSAKLVMAVGSCVLRGGVFGPSFFSGGGEKDVVPVNIEVPGFPPPPH